MEEDDSWLRPSARAAQRKERHRKLALWSVGTNTYCYRDADLGGSWLSQATHSALVLPRSRVSCWRR